MNYVMKTIYRMSLSFDMNLGEVYVRKNVQWGDDIIWVGTETITQHLTSIQQYILKI